MTDTDLGVRPTFFAPMAWTLCELRRRIIFISASKALLPAVLDALLDAQLDAGEYVLVIEGWSSSHGDYSVDMNCPSVGDGSGGDDSGGDGRGMWENFFHA